MTVQSSTSEMHSREAVHSRSFVAVKLRERVKGSLVISQLVTLIFSIKRDVSSLGLSK